ncbi:response regulator transcription factor [Paracoccus sp. M683]|uniref:response regulator transcription factor n=1 Tax=Paracoccus sp. M683 TaxID=2594268 RepID=UPI00117EFBF7|nr:response regulator [Paracoccus sp. M683]TRW98704.1 response regulator transcription factor [Paracoccus sp. M683]
MAKDNHPPADPTVFIVDDDPDIRSSLSRALKVRGYLVETFESATAFLDGYDGNPFGCLILDQGLPGMTGLELQKHLNRQGHLLPIIFITGHGGVPESVQAIKGGAVDFLEKPFRQADLIERIRSALDSAEAQMLTVRRNRDTQSRFKRLTPREREIVDHMLANPSDVSSKGIARALVISPRTVDHHRARILEKMEVGSVAELIDLALRLDDLPAAPRTD